MEPSDIVAPGMIRIVMEFPDTPFIRSALEALHNEMVNIRLDVPDLEKENPEGSKEWMGSVDEVAAIVESHPVPHQYVYPVDKFLHLMTAKEWLEGVRDGSFIDYDGYGYPVKDGNQSNRGISPSRAKEFPEEATHIAWANR